MLLGDLLKNIDQRKYRIESPDTLHQRVHGIIAIEEIEELVTINTLETLLICELSFLNSKQVINELVTMFSKNIISAIGIINNSQTVEECEQLKNIGDKYNMPLIYFDKNVSIRKLLNELTSAVNSYNHSVDDLIRNDYMELVQLVIQNQGLKRIINTSAQILGNPLIITDDSFNLLGYSSSTEVNDPIWRNIVDNGYCPYDIVQILHGEGFLKQLETEESPLFLDKGSFSVYIRRLVSEVSISSKIKGYIALLEYEKPLSELDRHMLKFISSIVAMELAKSDAVERARGEMENELLRDLVKGNIPSESVCENRVKSLDWKLGSLFEVWLISNIDIQRIGGEHFGPIQSIITKRILNSRVCFTSKQIIVLATYDEKRLIRKAVEHIEEYCRKNRLRFGIGRSYSMLMEISKSYKDAERALLLAEMLKKGQTTYYYNNMVVYDMLSQISNKTFFNDGLHRLAEYDKSQGTDYIKTLLSYFQNGLNLSKTAEDMYVHRNTIAYRLKKAEEILGCNMENYQSRLQLELSMLYLELNTF
ncbi:MAG: putative transcriptional regulator, PucR family [Clostridiales bacterium]|nr:putative transcriptional regulator, PucR family [Clostridiales bacterium]